MTYHVLARKWRPQTFADLVGQSHVVKALTFALSQNQVHHAYLFTGTRGVGKTSIARIFAKSLNCETNGISASPCGNCESCREITAGKFVDLIEVDAASRTGVDETRELIESVSYRPTKGRYKVYLIDEVHMFSKSSFNALLKTLEEPPEYVKFILATTDPEKLPITILSRCLQFNLKSLTQAQISQHLVNICQAESIAYDVDALSLLADAGDGSMRDTLSLTDQAIAYGQGNLNLSAVTEILGTIHPADIEAILFAISTNNPAQLSSALHRLDDYEIDARAFLIELMKRLQCMAWAKEGIVESLSPSLLSTVTDLPKPLIHLWYDIAEKALPKLSLSGDPRKAVEMTLLRMIAFIPDDWVTRHRTTFDASLIPDQKKPLTVESAKPEVADNKEINHTLAADQISHPPVNNEMLHSQEESNSVAASIVSATEVSSQTAIQTIPPWEEMPVGTIHKQELPGEQNSDFAQQVHAKPIAEQESLEAAEIGFMDEIQDSFAQPKDSAVDALLGESSVNPSVTANSAPDNQNSKNNEHQLSATAAASTQGWHLDNEASQEPPPSMDDINSLMQRGSEITAPIEAASVAANQEGNNKSSVAATEDAAGHCVDDFDWFTAIYQLSLSDYTLHFVSLGLLRLVDDSNRLQAILDLSPKHEVLSTEESVSEIKEALQRYFNAPINFSVNWTDVYEKTPAEFKQQRLQQDRVSVLEQFYHDPIVETIVNELDGKVIEDKVRSINS